jgi:hypothetical protein
VLCVDGLQCGFFVRSKHRFFVPTWFARAPRAAATSRAAFRVIFSVFVFLVFLFLVAQQPKTDLPARNGGAPENATD